MTARYDASYAADRLREVLEGMRSVWRSSLEQAEPGAPVDLYVCDADVFTMFMAPGDSHSYGALLRYQQHARTREDPVLKSLETRLAEFLGYLVFFQLQPSIPLALLPGHADDLDRVLNAIWKAAAEQLGNWQKVLLEMEASSKSAVDTSRTNLTKAEGIADTSTGADASSIGSLMNEIFRSLRGAGPVGKLFRADALLSSERVCHMDRLAVCTESGETCYFPPPLNKAGKYLPPVVRLADRIFGEMLKVGTTKDATRHAWFRRDAEAFAHLVWLNRMLAKEPWFARGKDGELRRIRRLMLVSGSNTLTMAIQELEQQALRGRELDLHPMRECIVAPASFLGHRLMDDYFQEESSELQAERGDTTAGAQSSALINFFDSMRGLLDSAIQSGDSQHAMGMLSKVRHKHEKLAETWQGRQLFGKDSRMQVVTRAIEDLETSGQSLHRLEQFLADLSIEAWRSFARSVTMLALETVVPGKTVQRNIPPVRFLQFPVAQEISGELYRIEPDSVGAGPGEIGTLAPQAIKKLVHEDPSHYTEFVCYALFGLVHRTLRSAEGCAEIALSVAESKPTRGSLARLIQGDEAYYLLAHIVRLRARRAEHLDRAEHCLASAKTAYARAADESGSADREDIRFDAESFSVECHRRYFECLGAVGRIGLRSPPRRDLGLMETTVKRGFALLARIEELDPASESAYVREYVLQQVLVNLVQLGLLWLWPAHRINEEGVEVYRPMEADTTSQEYVDRFSHVTELLVKQCRRLDAAKTQVLPRPSALATSVAAVGSAYFLSHRDVDDWFVPELARVASIDGLRFAFLGSVLKRWQTKA